MTVSSSKTKDHSLIYHHIFKNHLFKNQEYDDDLSTSYDDKYSYAVSPGTCNYKLSFYKPLEISLKMLLILKLSQNSKKVAF